MYFGGLSERYILNEFSFLEGTFKLQQKRNVKFRKCLRRKGAKRKEEKRKIEHAIVK